MPTFNEISSLPVTWKHFALVKGAALGIVITGAAWAWENAVPPHAATSEQLEAVRDQVDIRVKNLEDDLGHIRQNVDKLVQHLITESRNGD